MTMMKMSDRTRKIVAIIIILIGVMMSIGTAAYAANEPMKDYERVLLGEGFIQDEDDDTIWYYDGELEGYQITAMYDAYYDNGCIYAVDLETGEKTMYTFKWQPSEVEFESIVEYTF